MLVADPATREERLRVLLDAQRELEPGPVDESVARNYAALVAAARRSGRRPGVIDTILAATARRHSVPVVTRDRDFLAFEGEVDVVILD
ncbi:MAG: PIN domain-containing protein [Actinobacteria bacterium]|nr:PIN domain-containing protein [Actinomycetota bacterium]